MNYRHAYHAGNHADVLKHVVLCRVVEYLKRKDKPFRAIDAHGGIGLYRLDGIEAGKTLEWQGGIGRMKEPFGADVEELLTPYRQILRELNGEGEPVCYPGSPMLIAMLMRQDDKLIANELHPKDRKALAACFADDRRVTVTERDALTIIKAQLPPPERRGLILIDPPYELKNETEQALKMLREGLKRFASGTFMLWYPLKADDVAERIKQGAAALGVPGILMCELRVREAFKGGGLAGSGLVIVNPPHVLYGELQMLMPALAARLGIGSWGQGSVEWLLPPV